MTGVQTCALPILIISFFADSVDNFAMVAEKIASLNPDLLEMNASCPNTKDDYGVAFALNEFALKKLTKEVRKRIGKAKLIVKLSPNVSNIARMGQIVENEGADAICAINTGSGMIIDVESQHPILTNISGGLSGVSIRPMSVKAVYDLYKVVKIPIVGTGGVRSGRDALEMIMAGAQVVGVGSAIYDRGIDVFKKITNELEQYMKIHNIQSIQDLKGVVHD